MVQILLCMVTSPNNLVVNILLRVFVSKLMA